MAPPTSGAVIISSHVSVSGPPCGRCCFTLPRLSLTTGKVAIRVLQLYFVQRTVKDSLDQLVLDFTLAHPIDQWVGVIGGSSNAQGAATSLMMVRMWVTARPAQTRYMPAYPCRGLDYGS